MQRFIEKRGGKIDRFDSGRIKKAILKASSSSNPEGYEKITEEIFEKVMNQINGEFGKRVLKINEVERAILHSSNELGYKNVSRAYTHYKNKRGEARKVLAIATKQEGGDSTDTALLIESDSKEIIGTWKREKIVEQLQEEADLSPELAKDVSKMVENIVVDMYQRGIRKFSTTDIRGIVDLILKQEGLEMQRKKQALLAIPTSDFTKILFSKSLENSNVSSNNPEALNLEIAERLQKQFALENIFSSDVAEAHLKGAIHIHDLGYPARVYCSSHSLEYIKKYGLNQVLTNLESKSNPPNSAHVLSQHVQTFLASLQAHYAGALGFGFLNIFYSSLLNRPVDTIGVSMNGKNYEFEKNDFMKLVEQGTINPEEVKVLYKKKKLKEVSEKEMEQVAQNLIFAASQNAFSRGGQTLFIDFNVHVGVPDYMKNVPAIGPKGMYMIKMPDESVELVHEVPRFFNEKDKEDSRNGDADSSKLDKGKIITYGDLERTAQKFAKSLLEIWRRGDKHGRPFHFPKCDLHIDKNTFKDPVQFELFDFASKVASENGSVYFMFDRGDDAVLAQCCRLKEKITDITMLKYPEKLRFCGFQNVTINLAQASYKGKTKEGIFREIDESMELALKAHKQKAEFMTQLLETDGSPMRNLGKPSDDGTPYIDLKKATYIIGCIGLNEAVQALCGRQLHEGEDAYKLGLEIIAHMYIKIKEFKERTGLKFTIEETPAESATRRLAKVDWKYFEKAREVIKGSEKDPYYTNSIHFAPDANVGIVDRIIGQSKFHEMIESGAIIHAYLGEKRPDKESIKHLIKQTFENTLCSQLVFSPTYTECEACGGVMAGEKELCTTPNCLNSSPKTLDKNTLFYVTRVVGYYSRISHWNNSQKRIYEDRKKTEDFYAGKDLSWLHNPNGNGSLILIEFGKKDCPNCKILKEQIERKIKDLNLSMKIDFKIDYLDSKDEKALAEAAFYGVPLDSVPSLVIAGKRGYWRKTTIYSSNCSAGVCGVKSLSGKDEMITPQEIEIEIKNRLDDYDY